MLFSPLSRDRKFLDKYTQIINHTSNWGFKSNTAIYMCILSDCVAICSHRLNRL